MLRIQSPIVLRTKPPIYFAHNRTVFEVSTLNALLETGVIKTVAHRNDDSVKITLTKPVIKVLNALKVPRSINTVELIPQYRRIKIGSAVFEANLGNETARDFFEKLTQKFPKPPSAPRKQVKSKSKTEPPPVPTATSKPTVTIVECDNVRLGQACFEKLFEPFAENRKRTVTENGKTSTKEVFVTGYTCKAVSFEKHSPEYHYTVKTEWVLHLIQEHDPHNRALIDALEAQPQSEVTLIWHYRQHHLTIQPKQDETAAKQAWKIKTTLKMAERAIAYHELRPRELREKQTSTLTKNKGSREKQEKQKPTTKTPLKKAKNPKKITQSGPAKVGFPPESATKKPAKPLSHLSNLLQRNGVRGQMERVQAKVPQGWTRQTRPKDHRGLRQKIASPQPYPKPLPQET